MDRPEHKNANWFLGTEVEATPMQGHQTLFVIGIQNVAETIKIARQNNLEHVYLGANMSFLPQSEQDWSHWTNTIDSLLDADLWVTLDYDRVFHENVIAMGHQTREKFISMISVKIPHIEMLNANACIKIDDKDFKATNTGVWVHKVCDLKDHKCYTEWSAYTQDTVIEQEQL